MTGIEAQKATEERRLKQEVADDRARIKVSQDALERFLFASPAAGWTEAAEKMRYLLSLFAATSEGRDSQRQTLIANLISDIEALTGSHDGHAGVTGRRRQQKGNRNGKRTKAQQGGAKSQGSGEKGEETRGT